MVSLPMLKPCFPIIVVDLLIRRFYNHRNGAKLVVEDC